MPGEMDPGVTATPVASADPAAPLGAAPTPPPAEGEPGTTPPVVPARAESKVVTVPTASMKRIKDEEYQRGKAESLAELATGAGFGSSQELVAALQKLKGAPAPVAAAPAPPAADPGDDPARTLEADKGARREEGRYQRQLEKVLNERNKYASSAQQWQAKAREAQAEADAVRAEMHLRTIAAGVGVQDIDYAITLFSREVERLTPEQAETFNEKAFFEGLRKVKPLLFGEAVVPANTGTTPGGPTPPRPGTVTQQQAKNGQTDVRKLNPQEYAADLKKRGINPHAS